MQTRGCPEPIAGAPAAEPPPCKSAAAAPGAPFIHPSIRPPRLESPPAPMRLFVAFCAALLPAIAAALPAARAPWGRANTLCHTLAAPGGRAHLLSFLWRRPDGAPPVLVQSAWDARGGRLLGCAARAEPSVTGPYAALCARLRRPRPGREPRRRGPGGGRLERAPWGPELRRELAALEARRGACEGAEVPGRARVRRGWTMPGTLWCGAGDSAGNFSELGKGCGEAAIRGARAWRGRPPEEPCAGSARRVRRLGGVGAREGPDPRRVYSRASLVSDN